jgi:hypothetical protein
MKSPNDVGISDVVPEPLFWVVEECVGSVLFLVEAEGGFSERWVSCGAAVCVLEVGLAVGWLFLLKIHHAPNAMIATRTTTSATIRPVLPLFCGGCGGMP